jgi:hypothetical protein
VESLNVELERTLMHAQRAMIGAESLRLMLPDKFRPPPFDPHQLQDNTPPPQLPSAPTSQLSFNVNGAAPSPILSTAGAVVAGALPPPALGGAAASIAGTNHDRLAADADKRRRIAMLVAQSGNAVVTPAYSDHAARKDFFSNLEHSM